MIGIESSHFSVNQTGNVNVQDGRNKKKVALNSVSTLPNEQINSDLIAIDSSQEAYPGE